MDDQLPTFPDGVHIALAEPTGLSRITREDAIQRATAYLGAEADGATRILARHVLFTDTVRAQVDTQGQEHLLYQEVSAWIVRFEGINHVFASAGPRMPEGVAQRTTQIGHETQVVLDAETGEFILQFSY